jgi:hypothetical protein
MKRIKKGTQKEHRPKLWDDESSGIEPFNATHPAAPWSIRRLDRVKRKGISTKIDSESAHGQLNTA